MDCTVRLYVRWNFLGYCTVYLYAVFSIAPSVYMFFLALHRLSITFFKRCTALLYVLWAESVDKKAFKPLLHRLSITYCTVLLHVCAPSIYMFGRYCTVYLYLLCPPYLPVWQGIAPSIYIFWDQGITEGACGHHDCGRWRLLLRAQNSVLDACDNTRQ